jgi:hypothetical protein
LGQMLIVPVPTMTNPYTNFFLRDLMLGSQPPRRKCFISYYGGDKPHVDRFITDFGQAFIPKVIGVTNGDDFINSTDSDYVMAKIREKYLGDSTVTICLIGSCTHSRRYVDWELKTSLRQGLTSPPNGLLGILLPYQGTAGHLPSRFRANWNTDDRGAYAILKPYPTTRQALIGWIEGAFSRRSTRANLIANGDSMFGYNRNCLTHNETH